MDLGVDFSAGIPSQATISCWKGHGVGYAIVQYDAPAEMKAQMQACVDGGVGLSVYVYLYNGLSPWQQTPADRVRNALSYIQGFPVERLWLDFEDDRPTWDGGGPVQIPQVQACVDLCDQAGVPTGIYTRRFYWQDYAGNSTAFAHLPLWDARYIAQGPIPRLDLVPGGFDGFVAYGGWTKPMIHQWHNTTYLCGHGVDLNVMEQVVIPQPEPPHDKGIFIEGDFVNTYNGPPIPVLRVGGRDFPGRISKLFGDKYLWLRLGPNGAAYWSEEEGD